MNNWLVFALSAGIVSFSLFVLVNAFLYLKYRDRALLFWTLAWGAHAVRNVSILCGAVWGKSAVLLLLEQALVLCTGGLLLLGAYAFTGRRRGSWFPALMAAGAAWVCVAVYADIPPPWFYLPTYGLFGSASVITGWLLLKSPTPGGVGARLAGWALILWGLHHLDYPFLRPLGWFAPWGFVVGGFLGLLTALSLILAYFERLQHDLAAEQSRFRSLFHAQSAPILLIDPESMSILDANEGAERFYGYSRSELMGMGIHQINMLPPEELLAIKGDILNRARESFLFPHRLKNGEIRTVEAFCSPASVEGRTMIFVMIHDVTERIRAQDALRESEARYRAVVDRAGVGIVLQDASGVIRTWNYKAEEVFGLSAGEVLGKPVLARDWRVTSEDGEPLGAEGFPSMHTMRTGEPVVDAVLGVKSRTGEIRWITVNTAPIRVEGEARPRAVAVTFSDDTQRRRGEVELMEARRAAEASNQAKSVFLANMSHEIRTPLNGVIGMLQVLESSNLDPGQRRHLDMALKSALRLTSLLGDILDLSQIEANRLALSCAPFEPASLAEALKELFAPAARESGVALEFSIAPGVPLKLMGDEPRLRQVLFNLVGNAVKFTAKGHVRVEISALAGRDPGCVRLLFLVEDTGVGISEAKLREIFEPFVQGEVSYLRRYQGAGLGLAIVRRLVRLMGGSLEVDSKEGQGTQAHLTLPFKAYREARSADAPAAMRAGGREPAASAAGVRILYVEDEPVVSLALRQLLRRAGHDVTLAADGLEALELADGNAFDLILMDIQMPRMDGVTATRAIRESGGESANTPIVAVTAYAMPGDRERFLEAGMDAYLSKPVDIKELLRLIDEVTETGRCPGWASQASSEESGGVS